MPWPQIYSFPLLGLELSELRWDEQLMSMSHLLLALVETIAKVKFRRLLRNCTHSSQPNPAEAHLHKENGEDEEEEK